MIALQKCKRLVLILLAPLLFCNAALAAQQSVDLPFRIDYPLLRKLLISRSFPEKNETVTLISEGGGCVHLSLASPEVSKAENAMRLLLRVSASAGTPVGGRCYTPVSWQGYLALDERPSIDPENWQLSFTTVDSTLLGPDRQPTRITDILWNLIRPHIWQYIDGIRIDLLPPVTDLKNFLLPLFPDGKRRQTEEMLASMRPGGVNVEDDALTFSIHAEVDEIYEHTTDAEQLSDADLRRTVATWERWDGLLVYLITKLAGEDITREEQRTLTNVLLDTRYRFVNELSERTIGVDIIREQFVEAWQKLAPIFRRRLLDKSDASSALGYLAFVASADSLVIFDRLGPTMGVEISTEGMVRLARMLDADPNLLDYRSDLNPSLQKLFRFDTSPPEPDSQGTPEKSNSFFDAIEQFFSVPAALASEATPSFEEILKWKVPDTDLDDYLQRVENLLRKTSKSTVKDKQIPKELRDMFDNLIAAMAWQESCFRQFVVRGDKLTYLISYNNSSVGLMQINERVWRGLYRLDRLRWDIGYNARAGSEIAAYYLTQYGLKNGGADLGNETLARLVYALYNGGPSQHGKFLDRLKRKKMYQSDELFWQKYQWVNAGKINKVSICLTGR